MANTEINISTFVEFGFAANVRLTDNVKLGAGYRAILLTDVATASENLGRITTNFNGMPPSADVNASHSIF